MLRQRSIPAKFFPKKSTQAITNHEIFSKKHPLWHASSLSKKASLEPRMRFYSRLIYYATILSTLPPHSND